MENTFVNISIKTIAYIFKLLQLKGPIWEDLTNQLQQLCINMLCLIAHLWLKCSLQGAERPSGRDDRLDARHRGRWVLRKELQQSKHTPVLLRVKHAVIPTIRWHLKYFYGMVFCFFFNKLECIMAETSPVGLVIGYSITCIQTHKMGWGGAVN